MNSDERTTMTTSTSLFSHEATNLPAEITEDMPEIVENAIQAAFSKIAAELEERGYPVIGDFTPEEVSIMGSVFENFVRTMALNNNDIAALNGF